MKKIIFLTIFCFLISLYIKAQDSLYMKCIELPGFSLQSSINLEDSLIINVFDEKYNVVFSQDIQSLTYSDTTISDIDFFEIQLPESKYLGYEDSIGLPHLPSVNFTLQIPATLYNNSFTENNIICEYEDYDVHGHYYYPYQDYLGEEQSDFIFSEQYYTSDYSLTKYVELSTPFKAGNTTGIVVKIRPIQYNPQAGIIRIIKSISFDIPINDVPLTDILAYEMLDATEVIDAPILSEDTQLPFDENYLGKLLIVISDETYRNVLDKFVEHKNSKGFETEVVSINQIKNLAGAQQLTAEVLRNYLRGRYLEDNVLHRPRYLLLVGNYDVIPYSICSYENITNESTFFYSDLYYGCLNYPLMRHENDLLPEMFVGRWPVSTLSELSAVINKTIVFENNVSDFPAFYNIMMLSGIESTVGSNDKTEADRYKALIDIQKSLQGNLYQNVDIYDGRKFLNKEDSIRDILKQKMTNDLWMFVYVGHGENYLLNKPINLNKDELQKCFYDKLPPIALSFSCLTNQILDTSCYGKIWLTENNIGGVLHYGATGISFTNLNLDMSRSFFNNLNPINTSSISKFLLVSGAKFHSLNPNINIVRNQVEKYCIYGDPTLLMFGGIRDNQIIQNNKRLSTLNETIFDVDIINDIFFENECSVYIYDLNGRLLLYEDSSDLNTIDKINCLPLGVYIIHLNSEITFATYKLIINK